MRTASPRFNRRVFPWILPEAVANGRSEPSARVSRWSRGTRIAESGNWFLTAWARRLSWQETTDAFNTTWENVFRSVPHALSSSGHPAAWAAGLSELVGGLLIAAGLFTRPAALKWTCRSCR
jgi:hypothetical protein